MSGENAAAEPDVHPPGAQKDVRGSASVTGPAQIKRRILILSGKGGVGKSTVAKNLAVSLVEMDRRVGLLDVDVHGPSIPILLGLEDHHIRGDGDKLRPVLLANGLEVMSIGFLLEHPDDAVIWRGPMKAKLIKDFVQNVQWGPLDFLIVDSPPGTGDEPLSVAQELGSLDGAIVVTTPQRVAIADAHKAVRFCQRLDVPVLGVLENMSGFVCPDCGKEVHIFDTGGGEILARNTDVPFLGRIPIDPSVVRDGDAGASHLQAHPVSAAAIALRRAVQPILSKLL